MLPWCTRPRLAAGPSSVSATCPLWPLRGSVSLQMAHLHLSAVSYHLPSCKSSVPSLPELVAWQGAVTSSPHALRNLGGMQGRCCHLLAWSNVAELRAGQEAAVGQQRHLAAGSPAAGQGAHGSPCPGGQSQPAPPLGEGVVKAPWVLKG